MIFSEIANETREVLEQAFPFSVDKFPVSFPDNIRAPFFNRFTAFYFDVTVPVDPFVRKVKSWVRR